MNKLSQRAALVVVLCCSALSLLVLLAVGPSAPQPLELISKADAAKVLKQAEVSESEAKRNLELAEAQVAGAKQELLSSKHHTKPAKKHNSHSGLKAEEDVISQLRNNVLKIASKASKDASEESESKAVEETAKKIVTKAQHSTQHQLSLFLKDVKALTAAKNKAEKMSKDGKLPEPILKELEGLKSQLKDKKFFSQLWSNEGKVERPKNTDEYRRQERMRKNLEWKMRQRMKAMMPKWKQVPYSRHRCTAPYVWLKKQGVCVEAPYRDRTPRWCRKPYKAHSGLSVWEISRRCRAWFKAEARKKRLYEEALRNNSKYRYRRRFRPHNWSELNNNYHRSLPQRYPHGDHADLGDNYISGFGDSHGGYPRSGMDDSYRRADRAYRRRTPVGFRWLVGNGHRKRRGLFAHRHFRKRDWKRLLRHPQWRSYYRRQYRMGRRSPLKRWVRRLVHGRGWRYYRNKYGFPADAFPSARQLYRQLQPQAHPWRYKNHYGRERPGVLRSQYPRYTTDRHGVFPARTVYRQRWRKDPKSGQWKPVFEPRWRKCEKANCRKKNPNKEKDYLQGKSKKTRVCDPWAREGCYEVKSYKKPHDPIMDQIMYGTDKGKADPLGWHSLTKDKVEPADQVMNDKLAGSFLEKEGGEPVGDFIVRNWNGYDGIDHFDHHHWAEG